MGQSLVPITIGNEAQRLGYGAFDRAIKIAGMLLSSF